MRRSSYQLHTQTSEPVIVVEDDSNYEEQEEENAGDEGEPQFSPEDESPTMNPYLLSPYAREIRKHSLPTPQCAGITASQVRRLSERGEAAGPGPRQAEFLATLSTAAAPASGGRRHSVVTISKVPTTLFGRNRRESVACFSAGGGFPARVLPGRRESIACPPSTEPRGSVHNLQLDIMDDIVQARKVRMKVWGAGGERVCELQDDAGGAHTRYTDAAAGGRRYSDFVGTTLAPIPSAGGRRASELPAASTSKPPAAIAGIVCSNTDLVSILSLSTSSAEIDHQSSCPPARPDPDRKRPPRLRSTRSNSFDVSVLHQQRPPPEQTPSSWFARRHRPADGADAAPDAVVETEPAKVVWDGRSGSLVDAHALGSAIEVFLRQTTPADAAPESSPKQSPNKTEPKAVAAAGAAGTKGGAGRPKAGWFSGKGDGDSTETCDSSLCSTLKDLFVK